MDSHKSQKTINSQETKGRGNRRYLFGGSSPQYGANVLNQADERLMSEMELWGLAGKEEASSRIRSSRLRWAILFSFLGAYLGCLLVIVSHRKGNDSFGRPTKAGKTNEDQDPMFNVSVSNGQTKADCIFILPDLGYELVPRSKMPELTEFWVVFGVFATVLRFVFSSMGKTILRRWLFCVGVLSIIRGLSRLLTVRPTPESECEFEDDRNLSSAWVALLVFFRQAPTCADVLFSLHVVNLTLCAMVWLYYLDQIPELGASPTTVRRFIMIYLLVGYYLILATRNHYTADIFLWFFVTLITWVCYHQWVQVVKLDYLHIIGGKRLAPYNFFSRFTLWFEEEAEDLNFDIFSAGIDEAREDSIHRKLSEDSNEDDPEYDAAFADNDIAFHVPSYQNPTGSRQISAAAAPLSPSGAQSGYESFGGRKFLT